jgi:HSP20 family protein
MTWRSLVPTTFRGDSDPFKALRREMDRFFDDFWKRPALRSSLAPFERETPIFPDIDVFENDKMFQITAELPGLTEKDIKVDLNHNLLTISGEKKLEKEDKGNNYYICERSAGSFYRTIQIPTAVDENNIDAKMKDGILKITLPKSAEALAHTKQIEVKKA